MRTRFVILADTHFKIPGTAKTDGAVWNRVLHTRGEAIAESLVETVLDLKPDFLIHCGDITASGLQDQWDYAGGILDRTGCPWYAALGNHDTASPDVRALFAARYGLSGGRCSYSLVLDGVRFVFLDVVRWHYKDGTVSPCLDRDRYARGEMLGVGPSDDDLAWLESILGSGDGLPVVLVAHVPLGFKDTYPLGTMPKGKPPADRDHASPLSHFGLPLRFQEMRAIIQRHAGVRLCLAGHWHLFDATREGRVVYCQTGALCEFPCELRVADIDGPSLRVSTAGLKDPRFRDLSFVPEWGNLFAAGGPDDRMFEIALV